MADPYTILGVSRGASEKDVKSAYRKLAKELHPDRNHDNPAATARFAEVTKAYDLLSDRDKRARFDRGEIDIDGNPAMAFDFGHGARRGAGYRTDAGPGGFGQAAEAVDLGDIFDGLFGGNAGFRRQAPPARGANIAYRLTVDLVDAARLAAQRITLADGSTIDVKLPAGVETGTQMRLAGKGQAGPGGPGDAIVTIEINPHAFFRRDGDNIRLDLPVTLDEALRGARVRVPTPEGAVMMTIAPGSSSGRQLRLKGRGFHRRDGSRGDQIVTLQVDIPPGDVELARRLDGWSDGRAVRQALGE